MSQSIFGSNGLEFSETFMHYIGGLQKYTPLLMPIYAPHVNSYKRLFATYGSPKNINWGIGNRSCGFRIPVSDNNNLRVENRLAGSDTNPYLVFAANLASGFLGIKNKLMPTSETKESLFNQESTTLPSNMNEAIQQFSINAVRVTNTIGSVPVNGASVVIAVGSDHRDEAFLACRYLIDNLKVRVPIWKQEAWTNGSIWVDGNQLVATSV